MNEFKQQTPEQYDSTSSYIYTSSYLHLTITYMTTYVQYTNKLHH